ncbi:MAG: dTDP-4-dehydrorhamnose 3,5-epimerase [Planctomycetes bacterium]|nr:dTDP-4-dehydrorhamnose 3,5-epimerase [Planctomycetota bacterium]
MEAIATAIDGVYVLEPRVFGDERGFFFESFQAERFAELTGFQGSFVQDNHSRSRRGVLRGLHLQLAPHAQGKLVRVIAGSILDVAVDVRPDSPSFRQHVAVELSAENRRQLWVPPGLAHGFRVLSEDAEVLYKTTDVWAPALERSIRWDDPELAVDWGGQPGEEPILSEKDAAAPSFAEYLAERAAAQA